MNAPYINPMAANGPYTDKTGMADPDDGESEEWEKAA